MLFLTTCGLRTCTNCSTTCTSRRRYAWRDVECSLRLRLRVCCVCGQAAMQEDDFDLIATENVREQSMVDSNLPGTHIAVGGGNLFQPE